ncbi:uncharacterized protein LOC117650482 [Thrips palmi]|uniref:Uncharacterized protein LOC117650482 n=1 Tax=Thrips palmi TaxID=161013 RepID=A0A6P8ZWS2_THRPL|nr:uncharacterized protein LOC117650482 [Thrips palmi]
MARVSLAIVFVALVALSAAFDVPKFTSRLGKVSYAQVALARVKAALKDIQALPPKAQTLLDECLQSSALNAADMASTVRGFFNEVAGCINVYSDVPASVQTCLSKMSKGL